MKSDHDLQTEIKAEAYDLLIEEMANRQKEDVSYGSLDYYRDVFGRRCRGMAGSVGADLGAGVGLQGAGGDVEGAVQEEPQHEGLDHPQGGEGGVMNWDGENRRKNEIDRGCYALVLAFFMAFGAALGYLLGRCLPVIIAVLVASTAHAGAIRALGGEVSPHSNGDEKLRDGGQGGLAYEHRLASWKALRLDGGAIGLVSVYDTSEERTRKASGPSVACVEPAPRTKGKTSTDRGDGWSGFVGVFLKPTVRVWRIELYGLAGGGVDWMDTDGWDPAVIYGAGVDVEVYGGLYAGLSQHQIVRDDTGEYRSNLVFSVKYGF